jgi:hypothetical protein
MLTEAVNTAVAAGADPASILVRGDSAYCGGAAVAAVVKTGARFSFTIARNSAVDAAIGTIPDEAYTPVRYPGAVLDPDTGQLISNAHVAEVDFTAFASTGHPITGRLIVRRVLDANTQDPLFPLWRHHPFFTIFRGFVNSDGLVGATHGLVVAYRGFREVGSGRWVAAARVSLAAVA